MYKYIISFIIGTCMGSFLLCLSEDKKNIRSKCDYCHTTLKYYDLIPILSYLFLKGRCRYCDRKISIRYPLSELILGIIYLLIIYKYNFSNKGLILICMATDMFYLSLVDINRFEIPKISLWILLFLRIINYENIFNCLIGSLILCIPIIFIKYIGLLRGIEVIGDGDIKLIFILGLYLSYIQNCIALMDSSIMALYYILLSKRRMIPFGPFICISYFLLIINSI